MNKLMQIVVFLRHYFRPDERPLVLTSKEMERIVPSEKTVRMILKFAGVRRFEDLESSDPHLTPLESAMARFAENFAL